MKIPHLLKQRGIPNAYLYIAMNFVFKRRIHPLNRSLMKISLQSRIHFLLNFSSSSSREFSIPAKISHLKFTTTYFNWHFFFILKRTECYQSLLPDGTNVAEKEREERLCRALGGTLSYFPLTGYGSPLRRFFNRFAPARRRGAGWPQRQLTRANMFLLSEASGYRPRVGPGQARPGQARPHPHDPVWTLDLFKINAK